VKTARLLLLLLLVALLPWRSALAAGWLCAPAAANEASWSAPEHAAPAHAGCAGHDHDEAGADTHGPDAAGASHGCHSCAASCCANALPTALPALPPAPLATALRFPPLAVPAAEHRVSGQERPPRSC
jgi:hypothetical protein